MLDQSTQPLPKKASSPLKGTRTPGIYTRMSKRRGMVYDVVSNMYGRSKWRRGFASLADAKRGLADLRVEMTNGARPMPIPVEKLKALPWAVRKNVFTAKAIELGWLPGSIIENRMCIALSRLNVKPSQALREFRLGPYRLDFAFVQRRLALEGDGLLHEVPKRKVSDQRRDRVLGEWGWTVTRFNVDDMTDDELVQRIKAVLEAV